MPPQAAASGNRWALLNLGDAMLATGSLEALREEVDRSWRERGCPRDLAAFVRHVSEGSLHCEVLVYFTPAAAPIASAWGATTCAAPATAGLGLLAGGDGRSPGRDHPGEPRR